MKLNWQLMKLADVCKLINGRAYNKQELLATGKYPVLRVGNFFTNNHWYYSDLELGEDKYCDNGDLLYAWSASFGPRIWTGGKVIFHYHIWKVLHDPSLIDQKFLYLFFLWDTEKAKAEQGTGTTMTHVSMGSMNERQIPIPPLPEQQRIVGILDEAFAGIAVAKANAEKNLQNARALFESHLQAVFSQRGDGWVEKRLGDVADTISTGPFGTMVHKSDYIPDGIPMVNPMNIIGSRIVPSDKMRVSNETRNRLSRYMLRKGDIVIGRRGEMGRCALVTEKEEGWLCGTGSFFLRLPHDIDGKFFVAQFSSNSIKTKLEENSIGTTMSNLNHSILEALPLVLPSLDIQQTVIEHLGALEEETQHLESIYQQKLAVLDELKRSLLHRAFSGEL